MSHLPLKCDLILLYDGTCGFCHASVQFILKYEQDKKIYFAALQSPLGIYFKEKLNIPDTLDSVILVQKKTDRDWAFSAKSLAVMQVADHLRKPWKWFKYIKIIPSAMSDSMYNLIARNRYRIWSRYDRCVVPTVEDKRRLISDLDSVEN